MPTLFFGSLTLALRVPFPADRGPADEQPELYCKHATRAVACRHIGPIVANPTMHFEGLGQLTPPPQHRSNITQGTPSMEEFEQAMNASRAKDENNVPQLLSLQWIDLLGPRQAAGILGLSFLHLHAHKIA